MREYIPLHQTYYYILEKKLLGGVSPGCPIPLRAHCNKKAWLAKVDEILWPNFEISVKGGMFIVYSGHFPGL